MLLERTAALPSQRVRVAAAHGRSTSDSSVPSSLEPFRTEENGESSSMRIAVIVLAITLATPATAVGSVTVTKNAQRPALRVDARGYAEVSWSAGGTRRTLLIPPRGRALPGGRLSRPDVSRPTNAVAIPFRRALRRTPDGRYWALQSWRLTRTGPVELRFARWRGAPTKMELATHFFGPRQLLRGRATFHGRAVTGFWRTLEGTPIRHAAVLECFMCSGSPGWAWFNSVRTAADGSFGATVPPAARVGRYRASIVGPNLGATLAPDASGTAEASGPPPPIALRGDKAWLLRGQSHVCTIQ